MPRFSSRVCFFFFNDTATTEIYTLSLHDALPISSISACFRVPAGHDGEIHDDGRGQPRAERRDRKSTRLNSSHLGISYAVFCLKKKKKYADITRTSGTRMPQPYVLSFDVVLSETG